MIKLEVLKRIRVNVSDILDMARTIPTNRARTCDGIGHQWVSPEQYLEWAEVSFKGGGERGFVSAAAYAKRAVCRVIDTLILSYYLEYAKRRTYPEKIDGVTSIGRGVDSIVHELIIDPRNELEHEYKVPEPQHAKRAIQVAGLFIAAIRHEIEREPIIAFDWNLHLRSHYTHSNRGEAGMSFTAYESLKSQSGF